jgi:hypothetical protein
MKHDKSTGDKTHIGFIKHTVRLILGIRATGTTEETTRTEEFSGANYAEAEQKAREYVKMNPRRFIVDILRVPLVWILAALTWWYFSSSSGTLTTDTNNGNDGNTTTTYHSSSSEVQLHQQR